MLAFSGTVNQTKCNDKQVLSGWGSLHLTMNRFGLIMFKIAYMYKIRMCIKLLEPKAWPKSIPGYKNCLLNLDVYVHLKYCYLLQLQHCIDHSPKPKGVNITCQYMILVSLWLSRLDFVSVVDIISLFRVLSDTSGMWRGLQPYM